MSSASPKGVERPLRLALCEPRPEDAEWLIASLRNAGVASRPFPCASLDDLRRVLASEPLDAVVVGEDWDVFSLLQAHGLTAPVGVGLVVAASSLSAEGYERFRMAGVDDVYIRGMAPLACRVIASQAEHTQLRRESVQARHAMADTDKRVDALIEVLVDPIAYLNEGLHVKANQAYLDLMGMSGFEELEGLSLLDLVSREDAASLKEKIKRLGRGQGQAEDLSVHLASSPETPVVLNLAPAYYDGEPCLQVTIRGAAAAKEASASAAVNLGEAVAGVAAPIPQHTLDEWMKKDPGTGLFNRAHVLERVSAASAGSLWLIQVDHHEQVLNTIGISQLDALITSLGARVTDLSDSGAVIGRWTANSLAVVLGQGDEQSLEWAKAVQAGVAGAFLEFGQRSLPVTISLGGVALGAGLSSEAVLQSASQLLGQALGQSSAIRYLDPHSESKAKQVQSQERVKAVQQAVEENRLFLLYQPIVSFVDGRPCYEALVRLKTPDNKVETPLEFMPTAEEHGVAEAIDRWVLQAVLEKMSQRKAQGKNTGLLFKLSTASVRSGAIVQTIGRMCEEKGLSPQELWVEIPLSAAVSYAREARAARDELIQLGCHVVLSGLPSDPAALRMVSLMDAEWVKTNQDVTAGLALSSEKQDALRSMVQALHQEKRRLLTGFVEDAGSLSVLFTLGVDAMEGNFISVPLLDTSFDFSQFGF